MPKRAYRKRSPSGSHVARRLAARLQDQLSEPLVKLGAVVLALPPGGAPIGAEIARIFGATFDVFAVRKLCVPGRSELSLGAVGSGGMRAFNPLLAASFKLSQSQIAALYAEGRRELDRAEATYRVRPPSLNVAEKTVILVTDEVETAEAVRSAVIALRSQNPACILVATPIAQRAAYEEVEDLVDACVSLRTPENIASARRWYGDFSQTTAAQVSSLIELHARSLAAVTPFAVTAGR